MAVPGSRSTVQITTKQLIELFFSSQALLHCKSIPTLEYGFLVQVKKKLKILNSFIRFYFIILMPVFVSIYMKFVYFSRLWSTQNREFPPWMSTVWYVMSSMSFRMAPCSRYKQVTTNNYRFPIYCTHYIVYIWTTCGLWLNLSLEINLCMKSTCLSSQQCVQESCVCSPTTHWELCQGLLKMWQREPR